jgi:hypothetical protein
LSAIEALGWFPYSYQKDKIITLCKALENDKDTSTALREEAIRTRNYLSTFSPERGSGLAGK